MAQNDELLGPVGGGHPHPVLFSQLVGGLFNVGVGGLGLLGVDHVDVVVFHHLSQAAGHLIGVKDQDHLAPAKTLIVAQQVH